jgi:hypothetical protein
VIERTLDYRIINRLVSWKVRISRECVYLLEKQKKEIQGVWSFEKYKDGVRIHADMGKKCRGRKAVDSAVNSFRWIFQHTPSEAIYAGIPTENKPACQIAVKSGMDFTGESDNIRWFKLRRG